MIQHISMKLFFYILVSILSPGIAYAQSASFRTFSVDEGLAQSQVYSMLQDHQGLLWMGTRGGGISTFNGKAFQTYTERDGLVNNYVYKLLQDKQKRIWIATNNGLSMYDGKTFHSYRPKNYEGNFTVYTIELDDTQTLWLGTTSGLYRFTNGTLIDENSRFDFIPKNIVALKSDSSGNLWLGTGSGMYKIRKNGKRAEFIGQNDRALRNAITCISEDKTGKIWFGTYGDGLYCYKPNGSYRIDLKLELYKESVFDLNFDREGILWVACLNKGIGSYDTRTKSWRFYTQNQGLSNNHVRCSIEDNTGAQWIGTSGGGICQYNGSQFMHVSTSQGLGSNFVYSIFRDSKNRLWVGTAQNGVSVFENGDITQYNAANGFENVKIKSIVEDKFGTIYLGSEGHGIAKYTDGNFTWIKGTEKQYIRQFCIGKDQTIWAATAGGGLIQIEPETNDRISEQFTYYKGGLIQSRLTCVTTAPDGKLWYGSENVGIGWIDPETGKTGSFTAKNGLPSNSIRTLSFAPDNSLWVGMAGTGVVQITIASKPKIKQVIGFKEGLTSGNIYLLAFDKHGNLCLGTEKGLDILQFSKQKKLSRIRHYAKSDGFEGVETCQNSVFCEKDGKIWFGTINGLTAYDPDKVSVNTVPPVISFADVQLFYESLTKTPYKKLIGAWNSVANIQLPYDQNHLSFLFKGVNLRNPDGVMYSWKLKGFDQNWSPWSTENRIVYSNINSGNFEFLVRARNEDGYETVHPLKIKIEIETPFWKRTGFILFVVLIGIVLLYFLFKWQTNRIRFQAQKAQEQAEIARNLVELEQKALRLQMNPHFIFNALNSIQGLIGTQNETEARYYLAKFARLMRQILDNSRSTSITLDVEIATLENYLLIEKFCNGDRFDYTIETNLETEPNYLNLPPMLIQPFVENAIKHAFKYVDASKKGSIHVVFEEEQNHLRCTIRDNGIGREAASKLKLSSVDNFAVSTGLNVTQERLDLLSEKHEQYSFEIYDLTDEIGNSAGTEVVLLLPFL